MSARRSIVNAQRDNSLVKRWFCGTTAVAIVVALLSAPAAAGASEAGDHLKPPIVLSKDSVGDVALGSSEALAKTRLESIFGKPTQTAKYSGTEARGCGLNFSMSWRHFEAVFYRGSFVGYNTGYSTQPLSEFETDQGLRIGDTVAEAERIYGDAFHTSAAQGGSWAVGTTAQPHLYGYLLSPPRVGPSDRIAGIAAGHVGCPAMTP